MKLFALEGREAAGNLLVLGDLLPSIEAAPIGDFDAQNIWNRSERVTRHENWNGVFLKLLDSSDLNLEQPPRDTNPATSYNSSEQPFFGDAICPQPDYAPISVDADVPTSQLQPEVPAANSSGSPGLTFGDPGEPPGTDIPGTVVQTSRFTAVLGPTIEIPGLGPGVEVSSRKFLVAIDDLRNVAPGAPIDIPVMQNDIGATSITGVSTPSQGTAAISGSAVHYVANSSASGADSFTYTVTDGANHYATATVRLNIASANSLPAITVSTTNANITEPASSLAIANENNQSSFVFQRSGGDTTQALTVWYSISGTSWRDDITQVEESGWTPLFGGVVRFGANETSKSIPFTAAWDELVEGTETLTVSVKESSSYRAGNPSSATVNIADPSTGEVGDLAWVDTNGNGRQDTGEAGLAGVKVTLLKLGQSGDEAVHTRTTLSDGKYAFFENLEPQTLYRLRFELVDPSQIGQYAFSPKYAAESNLDSNVDPGTGYTDYFTVQAGEVNRTFDAGLIPLSGSAGEIVGPGSVPGLSRYTYTLRITGNATNSYWTLQNTTPGGSSGVASFGTVTAVYDVASNSTILSAAVNFENFEPAKVRLSALASNGTVLATKDINLVQVVILGGSLTPSSAVVYGDLIVGNPPSVMVASGPNPVTAPGEAWSAEVQLIGPGNNDGVGQINVGFIQHVSVTENVANYMDEGHPSDRWLINTNRGNTFLDLTQGTTTPWYSAGAGALISGAAGPTTIGSRDTPQNIAPATYSRTIPPNPTLAPDRITNFLMEWDFRLDVAARTTDTANGASSLFWSEAMALWQFGGQGVVTDLGVTWSPSSNMSVTSWSTWGLQVSRYEVPYSGIAANYNTHTWVPATMLP